MENMGKYLEKMMNRRDLNIEYRALMKEAFNDPEVRAFLNEHKAEISPDGLERSAAKIYEFVSQQKKIKAGQIPMVAGYFPKLVLSNHLVDVTYVQTAAMKAQEESQLLRQRVNAVNMPKDILNAKLSEYFPEGRNKAYIEALQFVNHYKNAPNEFHKGFYLEGDFGVGKTYLLGAMANELAVNGFNSTLIHFPTFAVEMKNSIASGNVNGKVNAIKRAPILMLDDVGAESMSSWIRDDVFAIILQYRMQEELATFFTSNETMAQFEEHLSVTQRGEQEPLKAKRIMERIKFLSTEIHVDGFNRRDTGESNG